MMKISSDPGYPGLILGVPLNAGLSWDVTNVGIKTRVGDSSNRPLRATASKLLDIATKQTSARTECSDFKARHNANCGGTAVYLAWTVDSDFALPFRRSSNGCRIQRSRFRTTQNGSMKVAKAVGTRFSRIRRTIELSEGL